MAITTYTQLQQAVADWSNLSDLTAYIPDFITLAEARLNDMLLLKNMESDEPLTLVVGQNYVTLPTGYISPIAFWLVINNERLPLDVALPQELEYSPTNGQPRYWAIDGVNVRFDRPAGSAYTAYLRCIKASNLSGSTTTNYLLTRRPDVYLAGCMVEVARFTKDVELFNAWEPKFLKATAELKAAENRARAIVPLRTDVPVMRHHSNIFRGE
jgi:hypothetical protein